MIINVDADIILYRACFAAEKSKYTLMAIGKGTHEFNSRRDLNAFVEKEKLEEYEVIVTSVIEPLGNALGNIKSSLDKIVARLKPEKVNLYLTGKGNYRYAVATTYPYKGNRDRSKRPHWAQEGREYLQQHWDAVVADGMEADDALGINQTADTILCSTDKDLDQITGKHYNFNYETLYEVDQNEADRVFYMQMLTGDSGDNVFGIKGIGDVKADRVLRSGDWQRRCQEQYSKAFKEAWKARWEENEILLRICRNDEDLQRGTNKANANKEAARIARASASAEEATTSSVRV